MTMLSRIMRMKNDSIENVLSSLQCTELKSDQNLHIFNTIKKVSKELDVLTPTVYRSKNIRNNAFSNRGYRKNVIIISDDLLNNLSQSRVEIILRHEIFHLKFGEKNTGSLNELLSDVFAVLYKKRFDEMKNTILSLTPNKPPMILAEFSHYFTYEKQKTSKIREKIQAKRLQEYEKDSYLHRLLSWGILFEKNNPNNWMDILHSESNKSDKLIYDNDVRLEFINDIQMMCARETEIVLTPHAKKILEFPKGDLYLYPLWHKLFKVLKINEKMADGVLEYVKINENKFNLVNCAKIIGQTEFATFLFVLYLIFCRKIILKWRFPCKYNFDY